MSVGIFNIESKVKVFPWSFGPWGGADLRFCGPQPDTSRNCRTMDDIHGTSVLYGVPLYSPAYNGTKLHGLITEANVFKRLVQGRTRQCSGWDWTDDLQLQVHRPDHCASEPHVYIYCSLIVASVFIYRCVSCLQAVEISAPRFLAECRNTRQIRVSFSSSGLFSCCFELCLQFPVPFIFIRLCLLTSSQKIILSYSPKRNSPF